MIRAALLNDEDIPSCKAAGYCWDNYQLSYGAKVLDAHEFVTVAAVVIIFKSTGISRGAIKVVASLNIVSKGTSPLKLPPYCTSL